MSSKEELKKQLTEATKIMVKCKAEYNRSPTIELANLIIKNQSKQIGIWHEIDEINEREILERGHY